jgi:hypothetical protein
MHVREEPFMARFILSRQYQTEPHSFRYHSDGWSMGNRMTVIASLRNRPSRVGRVSRTGNVDRHCDTRHAPPANAASRSSFGN